MSNKIIFFIGVCILLYTLYNSIPNKENLKVIYEKTIAKKCPSTNYSLNLPSINNINMEILNVKKMHETSETEIFNHVNNNGLVIATIDGETTMKLLQKLVENTMQTFGYPDFYNVNDAILVLYKKDDNYYWMIDYPIKYTPANIHNYVNMSSNIKDAKTMFKLGNRLLNPNSLVNFIKL